MKVTMENESCSVATDLFGGAITDFHLLGDQQINPLSFAFTKEQMPENNRAGAPYQGHFLCLGRWGLPSEGEINAGVPNHGQIANIAWDLKSRRDERSLNMETTGALEGLHVERKMRLDEKHPVFAAKETVTNRNPLGRLYNIVQHPTIAAPFLNGSTVIDCNAGRGFDQASYRYPDANSFQWPSVKDKNGNSIDLRNPGINYNSVFSFVVDHGSETGWLTAYSSKHDVLFGYIWKRSDYPWIHLWQHWEGNQIHYRGLEFGTAGIHQPFREILQTTPVIFDQRTFEYIDAGESISKNYFCFIYRVKKDFSRVDAIQIANNEIEIKTNGGEIISLDLNQDLINGL